VCDNLRRHGCDSAMDLLFKLEQEPLVHGEKYPGSTSVASTVFSRS